MGFWDKRWGNLQRNLRLIVNIFFRYIDDIRVYFAPIREGGWWRNRKWVFDPECSDTRNDEIRTKEEIAKSLNDVLDFLRFTTESEEEFEGGYLPTLDFLTKVLNSGKITFKHFYKPMINNLVLEKDTALSQNTIFSSLRQDLVRRLLNTSRDEHINVRLGVIENFTQLLINSKHCYSFIKPIILQALTKYSYMLHRDQLPVDHKKYQPLYRARTYQDETRKILKYIDFCTWYKDENLGEPHRQTWKRDIKRKGDNISQNRRGRAVHTGSDVAETTTTMFVPSSPKSTLLGMLQEAEEELNREIPWKVKLLEKAGRPLRNVFLPKFPINKGCVLGVNCRGCENNGLKCRQKGVVYMAVCKLCEDEIKQCGEIDNNVREEKCHKYIGETSRTFRLRVSEHMKALHDLNPKSFQLLHWAKQHNDDLTCPEFKFKKVRQFNDPLSRQLCEGILILEEGILNKRNEFRMNNICRLVAQKDSRTEEEDRKKLLFERAKDEEMVESFIKVLKGRGYCERKGSK